MTYRIASLLPSATEIVCALGARDQLVGVSHECDFPVGVESLPALTRARLRPVKTSREIDIEVRLVLQDALAVYEIELERLRAANPDVIVTQDLCDVCAVSFKDVCSAVAKLFSQSINIVNLHPKVLSDVWADILRVAAAIQQHEAGEQLVSSLKARVSTIAERAAALPQRPKILSIEWIDPVMIGGMWMPELISLAGGTPMVTSPGEHAPTLSKEELAKLSPDVVLVKPCGFSLERTQLELDALRDSLPWDSWSAVRERRVYLADGNAFFNRPGPRLVESLEILTACAHPEHFQDMQEKHAASIIRL
jgi:iron complex transport system substrate-binding protein